MKCDRTDAHPLGECAKHRDRDRDVVMINGTAFSAKAAAELYVARKGSRAASKPPLSKETR